jgi:hypothetical protein
VPGAGGPGGSVGAQHDAQASVRLAVAGSGGGSAIDTAKRAGGAAVAAAGAVKPASATSAATTIPPIPCTQLSSVSRPAERTNPPGAWQGAERGSTSEELDQDLREARGASRSCAKNSSGSMSSASMSSGPSAVVTRSIRA